MKNKAANAGQFFPDGHAYKITRPGFAFLGPHIGRRLTKKLETHRWHVLPRTYDDNEPETYEAVIATKTVTPNAIKKLVARAWCARQIMWRNRQNGILLEVNLNGHRGANFYFAAPAAAA